MSVSFDRSLRREMKSPTLYLQAVENVKAKVFNKNLGLAKKRERYTELLEDLEVKHNQIEIENKQRIAE